MNSKGKKRIKLRILYITATDFETFDDIVSIISYNGNRYRSHLLPLEILQKRVIRIIHNVSYLAHETYIFYSCKILKLKDIHKLVLGMYMFKNKNNSSFQRNHNYNCIIVLRFYLNNIVEGRK